jgi:hypothetical protein
MVLAGALAAGLGSNAAAAASHEREPVLAAVDLVAPSLLNGPGYSVSPQARVVGYQARFVLRTEYGEIEAESVEMLAIRIAELPAVEALHQARASTVFGRAMTDALRTHGDALEQVARNPLQTLADLPQGVARYFNGRLRRIGERATKLGDRAARSLKEDGSPLRRRRWCDERGPDHVPYRSRVARQTAARTAQPDAQRT